MFQKQHDHTNKNPKLFEENQPFKREAENSKIEELTSVETGNKKNKVLL